MKSTTEAPAGLGPVERQVRPVSDAFILREEIARLRRAFLAFAEAQHRLAGDCRLRGDEEGVRDHCATRETYRRAARHISDMLAQANRRIRNG